MTAVAATPTVTGTATAAPATNVDFEIFLPLRNKAGLQTLLDAQQTQGSPSYHQWLTPAQFKAQFGPAAVRAWPRRRVSVATAAGLTVDRDAHPTPSTSRARSRR